MKSFITSEPGLAGLQTYKCLKSDLGSNAVLFGISVANHIIGILII